MKTYDAETEEYFTPPEEKPMKPENPYKSLGRNLGTRVIDAWQEGFDAGQFYRAACIECRKECGLE